MPMTNAARDSGERNGERSLIASARRNDPARLDQAGCDRDQSGLCDQHPTEISASADDASITAIVATSIPAAPAICQPIKLTGTMFLAGVVRAVPRLAAGDAVTLISPDFGYASPAAFTNMFARALGA